MARSSWNRRSFFRLSGAAAAGAWLGGCGGGGDDDALGTERQLQLDATQAVAAIREGRLSAETYVGTLIGRARALSDLNTLIALDEAGALVAARAVDAARSAGNALPPTTPSRLFAPTALAVRRAAAGTPGRGGVGAGAAGAHRGEDP